MADALEFSDVFLLFRGALNNGRLKLHKQGVVFKSQKTGKVEQITASDVDSAKWLRVARGYGLKLILKNGSQFKFDGFKENDFDKLSKFLKKNFETELSEIDLSVKGWNWGVAQFKGAVLSFEVDKKPSFEIPLKDVSQATTGKNEVTVEFHQNDDAQTSLMEMRFYVPSTADGEDPVKAFQDQIMSQADVIQATGDAIVSFHEIACLTPRGRYSIKVYPTFLQLHGKTYDYKIPHTTCLRLFLLPHKDQRFMFFVLSMDPPIRQGQTRYPFLILQFERDEEISVNINLNEKDLEEKYGGKLKEKMTGPLFEVVSRVLKEIIGRKITVPGGFKGHSGTSSITCSHRAGNGLLYPLERGFIFVHKPPIHIRFDEISCVNFARGGTTGRTFDFEIELKNGTTVSFSNLERMDYSHLFDFVNAKNLRIRNKEGKAGKTSMMDDLMDSDDEGHDFYLEKVKAEAAEDDDDDDDDSESEDEDFQPDAMDEDVKEEFDSAASSSESEDSEGEPKAKKKKEVKKKPVSKPKESSAKKEKPSSKTKESSTRKTKEKKKGKDPNAPKKPMSGYFIWLQENREKIKEENPGISITEVSKKAGELWRNITDKSEWDAKAAAAKKKYEQDMIEYNKTLKESGGASASKASPASSSKKSKSIKDMMSKKTKPKSSNVSPTKFKSKEFIESSDEDSSMSESERAMRGFPRGNNTPHSARNFADWKFVAPCQPPPPSRKPAQGTQLKPSKKKKKKDESSDEEDSAADEEEEDSENEDSD